MKIARLQTILVEGWVFVKVHTDEPGLVGLGEGTVGSKATLKEEQVEWKRAASFIHADNIRLKTKRIQFSQLMWTARKFKTND